MSIWQSLPEFGTGVLYAILVAAAYTFAVALAAGRGRPRLLQAARLGAYGTVALVGLAVLVLAYAFVSHDFRISYVARYSDRVDDDAVPDRRALGRAGRLAALVALPDVASSPRRCVRVARGAYLELQPYVIATLMSIIVLLRDPDDLRGEPVRHERRRRAGRRQRAELPAPQLLHDHPPAEPLHRVHELRRSRSRSRSRRWSRAGSTTSGSSRPASGCSSPGCSCRSATRSACSGPTKSSAGAATGPGIRSRTRRACRGSRRPPTCTRR